MKHAPVEEELLRELAETGFCEITLTKFGPKPCFEVNGVELRETMIEARHPATGSEMLHTVVGTITAAHSPRRTRGDHRVALGVSNVPAWPSTSPG